MEGGRITYRPFWGHGTRVNERGGRMAGEEGGEEGEEEKLVDLQRSSLMASPQVKRHQDWRKSV